MRFFNDGKFYCPWIYGVMVWLTAFMVPLYYTHSNGVKEGSYTKLGSITSSRDVHMTASCQSPDTIDALSYLSAP